MSGYETEAGNYIINAERIDQLVAANTVNMKGDKDKQSPPPPPKPADAKSLPSASQPTT